MDKKVKEKILKMTLDIPGYFSIGPFMTTTGHRCPIYPDPRITYSNPKGMEVITDVMIKIMKKKKMKCDIIAGADSAGIALGAVIAYKLGKPFIYVRREKKEGGTTKAVEGKVKRGTWAVLIDDGVSRGRAKSKMVDNLRKEGLKIKNIIVILNPGYPEYKKWPKKKR